MKATLALLLVSFLLPISSFAYDQGIVSEYQCVEKLTVSPYDLPVHHSVYDIKGCTDSEIDSDVALYMNNVTGYSFNWFTREDNNMVEAINMLATDHSDGDGSEAFAMSELQSIVELYTSPQMQAKVQMGEYADSYMSGTGITALVFMFDKNERHMIVIEKFVYAE